MSIKILDAVTAVILHQGRLLMVQRQPHLKSFAGYYAFPGGKVDAEDATAPAPQIRVEGLAAVIVTALIREVREEVSLDLAALHAEGAVLATHLLGEATTPAMGHARFRTHFVRVDLARAPALTPELGEIALAEWATPADWLARYASGGLLLAPPTLDAIAALAQNPEVTRLANFDDELLTGTQESLRSIEPLEGLHQILVPSNTLPPAMHTNAWLIGDSYRVLIDPSPANRTELTRLMALIDRFGIDEILLSHHHPDHRQFANELATHYGVPLAMSADTRKRIEAKQPGWFGELVLRIYEEGDVVTRWLGQPVRVVCVPGHDEGQLGLMPDSKAWFLVGDLIQGIGTVVISKPEGHMGRYFASLERVIALDPAVILPSHGQATGSTQRLKEVLKHRQLREASILALHRAGKTPEQMLPLLYAEIDPRLLPLAARNIEAHLEKLEEEGLLA